MSHTTRRRFLAQAAGSVVSAGVTRHWRWMPDPACAFRRRRGSALPLRRIRSAISSPGERINPAAGRWS
ncbi:MAG: hypothetical protein DMG55_30600 [Acidobacteria bacterium]|nr:MAG: hypothetical protein DMG55_30600 [Acidobacteriota bacterium]